jgi:hypothetical protein
VISRNFQNIPTTCDLSSSFKKMQRQSISMASESGEQALSGTVASHRIGCRLWKIDDAIHAFGVETVKNKLKHRVDSFEFFRT